MGRRNDPPEPRGIAKIAKPTGSKNLSFLYVMPTCLQTSTHGIVEIMATYSREDFEEIASAIDKDIADVCQQEKHFEAAAMWYRLDRKAPKRQTPFKVGALDQQEQDDC